MRAEFEAFGYVALRSVVDPAALSAEFDGVMRDAFRDPTHVNQGSAGNQFRYAPTMCARTPVSLALAKQLHPVATELLGSPVLAGRAKATTYRGATQWHRDTELPVRSVGFLLYLEPLGAESGALCVLPGSHHAEYARAVTACIAESVALPGVPVPTRPGDVIAFDERLFHSSAGGDTRRQWRVDFVADTPDHDAVLGKYFGGQFSPGWDGGYDVDAFPSYGAAWRELDVRWDARLRALGVYEAAEAEEAFVRAQRRQPRGA